MYRRKLLQLIFGSSLTALAGCGNWKGQPEPSTKLRLGVKAIDTNEPGYDVTIATDVYPYNDSLPDVELVIFSATGNRIGQKAVGEVTYDTGAIQVECSGFPEIVSATSSMDCSDVMIDIVYKEYLTESPRESRTEDSFAGFWRSRIRECGESLPPSDLVRAGSDGSETTQTSTQDSA